MLQGLEIAMSPRCQLELQMRIAALMFNPKRHNGIRIAQRTPTKEKAADPEVGFCGNWRVRYLVLKDLPVSFRCTGRREAILAALVNLRMGTGAASWGGWWTHG